MKWCIEPIKSFEALRRIYITLEEREGLRRAKTNTPDKEDKDKDKDSELSGPYSALLARLGTNTFKNRYCDIYPYDLNRLPLPDPIQGNDYINASWIREPHFRLPFHLRGQIPNYHAPQPQSWIATQGPLRETCYDFLSLCLASDPTRRPQVIIQLTSCYESGREKSASYIPSKVGTSIDFPVCALLRIGTPSKSTLAPPGSEKYRWSSSTDESLIRVTLQNFETGPIHQSHHQNHSSSPSSSYFSSSFYRKNVLVLELFKHQARSSDPKSSDHPPRLISKAKVVHYECLSWPDRGVPNSVEPILDMIKAAKADSILDSRSAERSGSEPHNLSPILVHCSAGVGRTGTLIAIASFITQLNQIALVCPLDLKAQALSSLLPPTPFEQPGRLPGLPTYLDADLVAHAIDFLREQRVSMVQTEGQMEFVYKSVAHLLDSLL